MKKYFFGWTNLKWFVKELMKMYSDQTSYFSKKRIESGIAFIVLEWGSVHWMASRVNTIPVGDLLMWSSIQLGICGYMISQIQKEKKLE